MNSEVGNYLTGGYANVRDCDFGTLTILVSETS